MDGEENHGASVFLRDGDDVYRTYFTEDRGVGHLGSHWTYLDLTPYGRQERWEDRRQGGRRALRTNGIGATTSTKPARATGDYARAMKRHLR